MREKWSPKQKSNLVLNLIAELNSILKGNYFVSELFFYFFNKCCYTLDGLKVAEITNNNN